MIDERKKLLVLYAANSVFTATVSDYLESFKTFSSYHVFYANAVQSADLGIPLEHFDAVFVHYSVRLSYPDYISNEFANAVASFQGPKILSIQDEYENTEQARKWIERLNFDVVLTCVPNEFIQNIYPKSRFPNVEFLNVLTGYVPDSLLEQNEPIPIADRRIHIGYRGRRLHYFYGQLGREKEQIGAEVKRLSDGSNLIVDIESNDESRIYGTKWFDFIKSCKCMLGTESGANVFDFDGSIRKEIDDYLSRHPAAPYEDIQSSFLAGLEGKYALMNQVSPKVFEAIACRTALVLFEGQYSNVLVPGVHFIPLKKDFSNWPEVKDLVQDDNHLQKIADKAFEDVIRSKKWGYEAFVRLIDEKFHELANKRNFSTSFESPIYALVGFSKDTGYAPNCFTAPVSLTFIQDLRTLPSDWKSRMAMRGIEADFDLKKPGEWIRLAWVLFVPAKSRKKIGPKVKHFARRILNID